MTTPGTNHPNEDQIALLEARLESLLEETGTLVEQLEAVSSQQQHAIESGQVQQIVEVVAKREPVVQGLVRVGEELGAFIEDPSTRSAIGDQAYNAALRRIAGYEHTMKRLRERDAQDQDRMQAARDQLASQLASMGSGRSALKAYSVRSKATNPTMQDRRG
jgi:flagellar biosynthesis/type III secretory pathway chaperone